MTNFPVGVTEKALEMAASGHLRWKIENEGFNTQKNLGANLKHKYSRTDFNATKNCYQCMQIAHLLEQLTLLALDWFMQEQMQKTIPGSTWKFTLIMFGPP